MFAGAGSRRRREKTSGPLGFPLQQTPFESIDGNPHHEYAGGEGGDPGKDACRVEHAFCLRDQV